MAISSDAGRVDSAVDSAADAKVRARALGAWHGVFKVAGVSLNTSGLSLVAFMTRCRCFLK